jgi:hypothetical protein
MGEWERERGEDAMTMIAYKGLPGLKLHYLRKAEFHAWTDAFAKGLYWDQAEHRGCAVGCWSQDPYGGHAALSKAMGIPEALLRLADGLFEALPEGDYQRWPERFAQAIQPGADLGEVWALMLQSLLFDPQWGLAALSRRRGPEPIFDEVETFFDWKAEGLMVPGSLEADLDAQVQGMVRALEQWKHWDEFAKEDVRARKALSQVWQARANGPKDLDQAAWACRAAWNASDAVAQAQAEQLIGHLQDAPVLLGAS